MYLVTVVISSCVGLRNEHELRKKNDEDDDDDDVEIMKQMAKMWLLHACKLTPTWIRQHDYREEGVCVMRKYSLNF